jgi:thiol-disulfide isomerase/thioredoxin
MPRRVFARFLVFGLLLCCTPLARAGVSIGDPAPPLKIKTWLRGEPVDLAKDASKRVHLVEFWATWCPPCKASIPVLTTFQKNFGTDLAIIGVTDPDIDRNTPTMIKEFVKDQGPQMGYTVAMDDRGETTAAYMGEDEVGIPQAYVVGKDGKVAWVGSPLDPAMEKVLKDVVAGTYDVAAAKATAGLERDLEKKFAMLDRAYQAGQMDMVWKGLIEITQLDPTNAMAMELMAGIYVSEPERRGSIRSWVEEHISKFGTNSNAMAVLALTLCRIDDFTMRMPDLALKAGKAAYDANKENAATIQVYARTQYEVGAVDKAIELQQKAIALAKGEEKEEAQKVLAFYETCKK